MKTLKNYIFESQSGSSSNPKTKEVLAKMIKQEISKNGKDCDLNHIDVSGITDMSDLFRNSDFNGDISEWDVSNVEDMHYTFAYSIFNNDISSWDVSNVIDMSNMFIDSEFNQDISRWDLFKCKTTGMFLGCHQFNKKYKPQGA